MKTLVRLLKHCERRLGTKARRDLNWYDKRRPTRVSADALFEAYAWALLVSGISRKAATTWTERTAFWRVFTPQACKRYPVGSLLRRVGVSPKTRMGKKLAAVGAFGKALCGLSRKQVADRFFAGVTRTAKLGEDHVPALDALPFIGEPSARFMIRNMGGELIKDTGSWWLSCATSAATFRILSALEPGSGGASDALMSFSGATVNKRSARPAAFRNTFGMLASESRLTAASSGRHLAMLGAAAEAGRWAGN